jgi:hypothetical protein
MIFGVGMLISVVVAGKKSLLKAFHRRTNWLGCMIWLAAKLSKGMFFPIFKGIAVVGRSTIKAT